MTHYYSAFVPLVLFFPILPVEILPSANEATLLVPELHPLVFITFVLNDRRTAYAGLALSIVALSMAYQSAFTKETGKGLSSLPLLLYF